MKNARNKLKKGYTLVEVLMAVAIFFTLVAGPSGLFISSLRSQARILALREVADNTSYVFEYVSRALRMAKKELNCGDKALPETCFCLKSNGYGSNYEITQGGRGIKFNNYQDTPVCQEFFWDINDNRFKESKNGAIPAVPLTSDDLEITMLKFEVFGEGQEDDFQPRVTILFEITKKGLANFPAIRAQTTVSQRNLDIWY